MIKEKHLKRHVAKMEAYYCLKKTCFSSAPDSKKKVKLSQNFSSPTNPVRQQVHVFEAETDPKMVLVHFGAGPHFWLTQIPSFPKKPWNSLSFFLPGEFPSQDILRKAIIFCGPIRWKRYDNKDIQSFTTLHFDLVSTLKQRLG